MRSIMLILSLGIQVACAAKKPDSYKKDSPVPSRQGQDSVVVTGGHDEGLLDQPSGGMTSGGGNITIAKALGQEKTAKLIAGLAQDLRLFFNFSTFPQSLDTELKSVFLDSQPAIFELLNSVPIVDSAMRACTSAGKETDGSFAAKTGICLSSSRLGSKLDEVSGYAQLMALAVHEFAHAAGQGEAVALSLQRTALTRLAAENAQTVSTLRKQNEEVFGELDVTIVPSFIDTNVTLMNNSTHILETFGKLQPGSGSLAIIQNKDLNRYFDVSAHIFNLLLAGKAGAQSNPVAEFRAVYIQKTEDIFQGNAQVSCTAMLKAFRSSESDPVSEASPDCQVRRLVAKDGSWLENGTESLARLKTAYDILRALTREEPPSK